MWRKRTRPTPEELEIPDDLDEARALRQEAQTGLIEVHLQAPLVRYLTSTLIDREGKNHYMETLYQYVPRGTS